MEDAVDAEPDDEGVLLRIEMEVGGAVLGGLKDDRVDKADERGVGNAVIGLEVVRVLERILLVELVLDERSALPRPQWRGRPRLSSTSMSSVGATPISSV